MSRTVTALYDTRPEAEAARDRLASVVDVESARILDKDTARGEGGLNDRYIAREDRHAYDEGLRRGGYLLCSEVDSDEDADKIIAVLEQTPGVDLDDRQNNWRSEGWAPYQDHERGRETEGRAIEEERIPVVEEEVKIGKRQVERGGARVRSYVRETPVHEQVSLRDEHVSVERRPVNERLGAADLKDGDLMRDRTIEMTETDEEAVVGKEARVREEVVVKKTADERVEQIDDTVRRTEVDVDERPRSSNERPALGGLDRDRR